MAVAENADRLLLLLKSKGPQTINTIGADVGDDQYGSPSAFVKFRKTRFGEQ